jgi:hypothetical protein
MARLRASPFPFSMTLRRAGAFTSVILVLLVGCNAPSFSVIAPESFGLEPTTSEGELVRGAMSIANNLLERRSNLSFVLGEGNDGSDGRVPVFVLASINLTLSDVMWVPKGCKCVYVHARGLRRWLDKARSADGYGDAFEEGDVVAFFLLHEMGHVSHDKPGALLDFEDSNPSQNMEKSNSKKDEEDADAFAEGVLKKALESNANGATASVVSQNIAVLAINIYTASILGVTLNEILCSSPKIYWDWGFSHPNLAYRLVRIAHDLAPSEMMSTALTDFENCRAKNLKYFDAFK